MKMTTIITIVLILVVGSGGFFAGMKYQQNKQSTSSRQLSGGTGGRTGMGNNRMGMRPVAGEIISSDDKSVTVKLPDGSSKIIFLSDKTMINKATAGSKDDLKTGIKIVAFGTENADGTVAASNIQVNPTFNVLGARTPNQKTKSPDAREIIVDGSNYQFEPSIITLKKGEKVRIVFKNSGGIHDFRVDELNIATATVPSGQEDFVEFTPDKTGSFEFYCSIGNHRVMGMKGTLVVE